MTCPVCPTVGWFGGWIGGYFGIQPPESANGRILSAIITASLISITIVALKVLFNVSPCVGGIFNLSNVVRVGVQAFIMGIIYSIGVNYLLNRYVFTLENEPEAEDPSCHCQCNQELKEP